MRYIVTVAVLILSYATTASYAQQANVSAPGAHSCGKYLEAVRGHAPGKGREIDHPQEGRFSDDHTLYMAWLEGFFTATNLWVLNEPKAFGVISPLSTFGLGNGVSRTRPRLWLRQRMRSYGISVKTT